MCNLGAMAFWSALGVSLFVAMALDRNVSKAVLLIELIPALFLTISTRDFMNHMRARGIRLQKEGLEIAGDRCPHLLEWKNVERICEKKGGPGGFTIFGRKREKIFIPRAVTGYEEIREYILQMTSGQNSPAKSGSEGNPQA